MGNIRYLDMNHPVNDAGCVGLKGYLHRGNSVKEEIESEKQRTAKDKLEVDETILLRQR